LLANFNQIAYSGLRGAVAYALVNTISSEKVGEKEVLETTVIVVIFFTIFVQGPTLKPLLSMLRIKTEASHDHLNLVMITSEKLTREGLSAVVGSRKPKRWTRYAVPLHFFLQRLLLRRVCLTDFNANPASERQYIIAREFYELCQERNNDRDCDISCCWRKRKLGVPLNVEATENAHLTEPFLSSNSNSAYLDA